jgi:hypothetical protein
MSDDVQPFRERAAGAVAKVARWSSLSDVKPSRARRRADPPIQLSRKLLSTLDRLGCLSFRNDIATQTRQPTLGSNARVGRRRRGQRLHAFGIVRPCLRQIKRTLDKGIAVATFPSDETAMKLLYLALMSAWRLQSADDQ